MFWTRMNVHAEIHKHAASLPFPVIDFYQEKQHFPFVQKLILLEERLSTYTSSLPIQYYFKSLFMGLCQYYLQRSTYEGYLEQAQATGLFPEILPTLLPSIDRQVLAERTLVIVSFDDQLNKHYTKLQDIHQHVKVIVAGASFEPESIFQWWNTFDQVFLAGHGEDQSASYEGHIRLGKKILTPGMITKAVKANSNHPSILGIFTCGDAFYSMDIKRKFDFFIADHQSSVPQFIEMFLYGYLTDYYRSYSVLQAFQRGRVATIFSAKSDPTYELFASGINVKE
jgi:hypothetical protein